MCATIIYNCIISRNSSVQRRILYALCIVTIMKVWRYRHRDLIFCLVRSLCSKPSEDTQSWFIFRLRYSLNRKQTFKRKLNFSTFIFSQKIAFENIILIKWNHKHLNLMRRKHSNNRFAALSSHWSDSTKGRSEWFWSQELRHWSKLSPSSAPWPSINSNSSFDFSE